MTYYLYTSHFCILFFVVLLWLRSTLIVSGYAISTAQNENEEVSKKFFELKKETKQVQNPTNDKVQESFYFKKINLPLFITTKDGLMVAVVEANHSETSDDGKEKVDLVARFVEAKDGKDEKDWGKEIITNIDAMWKTQLATQNEEEVKKFSTTMASTVSANGEKIYVFLLNITDKEMLDFKLVEGIVNGEKRHKTITWKTKKSTMVEEGKDAQGHKVQNVLGLGEADGFTFLAEDNKIIFFVKGNSRESGANDSNRKITAFYYFDKDTSSELQLKSLGSIKGWYSFFHWGGQIFKAPTNLPNCEHKNIMVFNANEIKKFAETNSSIVRLRDFFKDKSNFTTANIKGRDVLLFTQQKNVLKNNDVYLWMTDGTHVSKIGTIVTNIADTFYGSVLYTNNELFAFYQKYDSNGKKEENNFLFKRLKDQLDQIKFFLDEWKKSNETVLKLCEQSKNANISCTIPPPTDGLVGFLHETTNDKTKTNIIWKDGYYYSNVTVVRENAEKITNGLKFSGAGKGAEWSMKSEQKEMPYNFIDFGFTLLATVIFDSSKSGKDNSIFGVKLTQTKNNNVGLWCTANGKWGVSTGTTKTPLTTSKTKCEHGKTYNVAFVLSKENNKNLEIYVNGEQLKDLKQEIQKVEEKDEITHFYFGANNNHEVESHVTITNVFLYNRPFTAKEIDDLKNYVRSVEIDKNSDQNVDTNTTGSKDQQSPSSLPEKTIGEEEKDKKSSRTEDGCVGGGGVRVFSLLLALLCVFVPLLHL